MSATTHVAAKALPLEGEYLDRKTAFPPAIFLVLIALVGGIACLPLYNQNPTRFAFSWLFAFSFYFTLALGSLFWVMLHHATNSGWSVTIRRQFENLASLLPFVFLFLIPIVFLRHDLFAWMRIKEAGVDPLLDAKRPFLNEPFFFARIGIYVFVFAGLAWLLRGFSLKQDKDGDPRWTIRSQGFVYALLLPFALTLTAAAIDYLMALNHHWFSTMWGVYFFAGAALNSMALLIVVVTALRSAGCLQGVVTIEHYHLMGKLLFAFTVFWAYIAFSQYFLIWYANIPEETIYFLFRNVDSWHTLSLALVIGHFFVPFLVLIARYVKKSPVLLSVMAGWTLLMHLLDLYIIVMPNYGMRLVKKEGLDAAARAAFDPQLSDLVCLVTIGAALAAIFLFRLPGRPLYPHRDPRLAECLAAKN